jgi:hypothetical protein
VLSGEGSGVFLRSVAITGTTYDWTATWTNVSHSSAVGYRNSRGFANPILQFALAQYLSLPDAQGAN